VPPAQGLVEHFGAESYLACESMSALIRENIRQIGLEETQGRRAARARY
jgi:hypothetical protein